ncbi:MAG: Crp/Fnr family transcriptional regulator, partial [Cytophagales bacterium]
EWIANYKSCKKNEFLYMPEEDHRKVYSIKEGFVKIGMYNDDGNEIILDILKKGDWFGEITFGASKRQGEFAMSMSNETMLCNFNSKNLEDIFHKKPELAIRFTKKIGVQQLSLTRRFSSIIFKDARQRLIDFFREQVAVSDTKEKNNISLSNHLTHQDIASLNGLARQTVSTLLGQFKEEGILDFDRKKIFIADLRNLK